MYTLEFDIGVVLPYSFIPQYLSKWKQAGAFEPAWVRGAKNCDAPKEIVDASNLAGNLIFQLLATDLPLRFTPQELALGVLTLALDIVYAKFGQPVGVAGGFVSPIKFSHYTLLGHSIPAVMEVREGVPSALAPYAAGDSAVRASLGMKGGVAPVAAHFSDVPGTGSKNSSYTGGPHHSADGGPNEPPAPSPISPQPYFSHSGTTLVAARSFSAGAEDDEEAPQLARADD
jgi:hypothetical protein